MPHNSAPGIKPLIFHKGYQEVCLTAWQLTISSLVCSLHLTKDSLYADYTWMSACTMCIDFDLSPYTTPVILTIFTCNRSAIKSLCMPDKWSTPHLPFSTFWSVHLHASCSLCLQSPFGADTKGRGFLTAAHAGAHKSDVVTGSLPPPREWMRGGLNSLMLRKHPPETGLSPCNYNP